MSKEVYFITYEMHIYGGLQRRISLLANKMSEKGYRVSIISLTDNSSVYPLRPGISLLNYRELCSRSFAFYVRQFLYSYAVRGIYTRIIRPIAGIFRAEHHFPSYTSSYYYYKYAWFLREFFRKHPDSTVFAFTYEPAMALAIVADELSVKPVFCEMNAPTVREFSDDKIRLKDRCAAKYRFAVFQTEEEKAYYDAFMTGDKRVIPNPVRKDLPAPHTGERSKRIVNFCRIDRQKNLPLLIGSFSDIRQKHPEYRLEIYGKGEGRDEEAVLSLIRENHLENCVSVIPFCADVHIRILDAAMFVSTSDYEGISNSMLEAMAIGLPCVCTDCDGGGARAMIKDGVNGLLVPKGDKEAVAAAMERLIADPAYAESLGRRAASVRELLDEEKITEQWIEMI